MSKIGASLVSAAVLGLMEAAGGAQAAPAAAVKNILLLRQIVRAVESKSDGSVPDEFFHDMLDEQFSEEETVRQLETAISWGRYAELFDFDASRRRFIKPERLSQELGESEEAMAESDE